MEDLEDDVEPMKYATWSMALIIFFVIGTSATLGHLLSTITKFSLWKE